MNPHPLPAEQPIARAPLAEAAAIRVFLAEDHRITLWGLQHLINASATPRMQVVGTATSRAELLDHPAIRETDVVLLDLDLGGEDSTEALADLQQRSAGRVLILTGSNDPLQHRSAIFKGARGILHKSQSATTLLRAIDKVHAGEVWLERGLLGDVLSQLTSAAPPPPPPKPAVDPNTRRINSLTPRERAIVATLSRDASAKLFAIAERLSMSENTLRNHLTTVYSKLGVRGRLELHLFATEHHLLDTTQEQTRRA